MHHGKSFLLQGQTATSLYKPTSTRHAFGTGLDQCLRKVKRPSPSPDLLASASFTLGNLFLAGFLSLPTRVVRNRELALNVVKLYSDHVTKQLRFTSTAI
jgi:hypothetical protein